MIRRRHPIVRCLLLLLFAVICWRLIVPALDMPTQGLPKNILSTIQATILLLVLAVGYYLFFRPRLHVNLTDGCAAILWVGITVSRFSLPGLASAVKYDEILLVSMLYITFRILFVAERRAMTVLFVLLCVLGIYEAWLGMLQIYGLAYSNHGLFKITGTLFNPGPYAGFLAPVFICATGWIVCNRNLAERFLSSWKSLRRQPLGVWIWGVIPYLLSWGAALMTIVVLPATMSRAALIAVVVCCGVLILREFDVVSRFRHVYAKSPLRLSLLSGVVMLLLVGVAVGAYYVKHPSAEGRMLMWKIDTRILLNHPFCGVGLGNFAGAFGDEQANYFASEERSESEILIAGCPESGFNEFLQFGAEMGAVGFVLLLLVVGTSIISQIKHNAPWGYGLLAAVLFACFSYPWSVLPLLLLFVLLLAGAQSKQIASIRGYGHFFVVLLLAGAIGCWPGVYNRYAVRADAHQQWADMRIWINSERYDYLVEDGDSLQNVLQDDFRFLYDYGYALHKTGNYGRSNEVLQKGMQISSDPMFWNIAGKNYEALGDFSAAECAYLRAYNGVPHRIYPLYLLTKLYAMTGQSGKARVTAYKVVSYKPKIESIQTREMQKELRRLINFSDTN